MGIAFCRVNRRGQPDYWPNRQRHHLLPVALFRRKQFRQFFIDLMAVGFEFDDFPTNGVLLPTTEAETLRCGLPLHRGPHPRYNALILMRAETIRAVPPPLASKCGAAGAIRVACLSRQPSPARSDACKA